MRPTFKEVSELSQIVHCGSPFVSEKLCVHVGGLLNARSGLQLAPDASTPFESAPALTANLAMGIACVEQIFNAPHARGWPLC